MSIPELVKQRAERRLAAFCDQRIPRNIRHQLKLTYGFRGDCLTLYEERVSFFDPNKWTKRPITQFRFDANSNEWSLYCANCNQKWLVYARSPINPGSGRIGR